MEKKQSTFPDGVFASELDQHRMAAEDFASIYSNNVSVSISQWDVGVVFGEISGRSEDGKSIVRQKLKVNMSKELAKVFKVLLEAHIDAYENKFGEIKIPDMRLISEEALQESVKGASRSSKAKKRV